MTYKSGEIVVLTTKRGENWSSLGYMDHYCGAIVQLTETTSEHNINFAESDRWRFQQVDILRAVTADEIEAYKKGILNIKKLIQPLLPIFN